MMRTLLAFVVVALLASAQEEKGEAEPEVEQPTVASDVVVLTDENYDATIAETPVVLVEFYAPWCHHCQELAPIYEQAATALKGVAVVAKVDATVAEKAATANQITGFPTIRLFIDGTPTDYTGGRTVGDMVNFVKKALVPAVVELTSPEELVKFAEDNEVSIVARLAPAPEEQPAEGAPAKLTPDAYVAIANSVKLSTSLVFGIWRLRAGEPESVVLHRKGDAADYTFDLAEFKNAEDFLQWANVRALPLLDEIGPTNFRKYFDLHLPLFWLILDGAAEGVADVKAAFQGLARDYVGKVPFVWLDNAKFPQQAAHFGLKSKALPAAALVFKGKYGLETEKGITVEEARAWIEQVLEGKVEEFVKSGEVPEDNDQRNVFEVTGKTFAAIVEEPGKDVIVEFFADYCGHCKALAPIYEEFGKILKPIPTLRIARVNVPQNDVPLSIRGYPTILLFPSNNKHEPVPYEGTRTLGSLLAWAQKTATIPFEMPEEASAHLEKEEEAQQEEEDEHFKQEL